MIDKKTNKRGAILLFILFTSIGIKTCFAQTFRGFYNIAETTTACDIFLSTYGEENGICWSTQHNPTIDNNCGSANCEAVYGLKHLTIFGLSANTTYYVRVFYKDGDSVSYSEEASFETQKWPSGTLPGLFSVADGYKVKFAQGNIQYQKSNSLMRFTDKQWGSVNQYVYSSNYGYYVGPSDWFEYFGWATAHYPIKTDGESGIYNAYGTDDNYNLYDQDGTADWGYNAIHNGGNITGHWRTWSIEECSYMLYERNTPSGIRFVKAKVNEINGLVLLPDNWSTSWYSLSNPNNNEGAFDDNVISESEWNDVLEPHGAVFLPASGYRYEKKVYSVGSEGCYWTSSVGNPDDHMSDCYAKALLFAYPSLMNCQSMLRAYGHSVRLITSDTITKYTIGAYPNFEERGTVTGGGLYTRGASVTLTATANEGYTFISWSKDGTFVSHNSVINVTANTSKSYVANFLRSAKYTISATANPSAGGTVSGGGEYYHGSSCTLTATPKAGYTFIRWTKNGSQVSTNSSYSFTVTEDASYVAEFGIASYDISVSANPSAGGTVSGGGTFNYGNSCTLTATPNTGYTFVCWMKNGSQVSTNSTYSFTVTGNANCEAVFSLIRYTVSVSTNPSNGGTVSGGGTYNHGSSCTLTATPNNGYTFVRWTKNGSQVSTNPTYSFTVIENYSYVAVFSVNSYTVSVSANFASGGTVSGGGTYNYGSSCTITATPNAGFVFNNWMENNVQVSTEASYTFTVTGNRELMANFDLPGNDVQEYVDLDLPSGLLWATCNLGANNPEEYGDYYAWAETQPKSIYNWSTYIHCNGSENTITKYCTSADYGYNGYTDDLRSILPEDDAATVNLGDGWRIPYNTEFAELKNNTTAQWITVNGINGWLYTGTNGNSLFLPVAGYRNDNALCDFGYMGRYWTKGLGNSTRAWCMIFDSSHSYGVGTQNRSYGFSIRAVYPAFRITATANISYGGTVTGTGTYREGETCTLMATPNPDHTFVGWMENGTVVSTDAIFSFTVTGSRSLVANFISRLTVYEGTSTNYKIPAYVDYFDDFTRSQFIIPADDLIEINNGVISALRFYTTASNIPYTSVSTVDVYLMEVDYTQMTGFEPKDDGQIVYQGLLDFVSEDNGGLLTIEFDGDYTYRGGNLLIGIENTTDAGWKSIKFYGTTVPGAGWSGSNSSSLENVTGSVVDFIPKTTFDFIPGNGSICFRPSSLEVVEGSISPYGATIVWDGGSGNYNVQYKKTTDSDWTDYLINTTLTTCTFTNLDEDTSYSVRVQSVCDNSVSGYIKVDFTTSEACPDGMVCIGDGKATNNYLPLNNYYKYSLTQQIYTKEEISENGAIYSIELYKKGTTQCERNLDIYMVNTDKASFDSVTDWIPFNVFNLVFSGTVSFINDDWTSIMLDNPFVIDETKNVALIINDKTGSYKSNTPFYAFPASNQAIRVYRDNGGYNPEELSTYNGVRENSKNRVRFAVGEPPLCNKPFNLNVNYSGGYTAEVTWLGDAGSYNIDINGVQISDVTSPYTITALQASTTYEVKVQAKCDDDNMSGWTKPVSFTSDDSLIEEDVIVFADPNVKAICIANWDTNGSGELSYEEAASVTDLGQVFRGNTTITSFEELQYFTSLTTICNCAFQSCSSLTGNLYIPNSVRSIGSAAFYNCSGFTGDLIIPNSVTYIGYSAFEGCSGLTGDLSIPNTLTSLAEGVFRGCSGLTGNLSIPDNVTSIGMWAFENCSGFTGDLVIPNSVTSIDDYAFMYCSGFDGTLTLSNSLDFIGRMAFYDCSGLKGDLNIPNSVTCVESEVFMNCSGFDGNLIISNALTSINSNLFGGCSGFTGSLIIPDSVSIIGAFAFTHCSGLTSINMIPETPPSLGEDVFFNVNKTIPVYVPCGSLEAYQTADGWSEFTNIIEMCEITQTIELNAGWNWVSFYVEGDPLDLLDQLKGSLGDKGLSIESQYYSTEFDGEDWLGELDDIGITSDLMYLINVVEGCTITLQGTQAVTETVEITINPGWNWIGFPSAEELELSVAMSGFDAEEEDTIENQQEGAEYDGEEWFGFETLIPGQGLLYFSNSDVVKTLVFKTGSKKRQ